MPGICSTARHARRWSQRGRPWACGRVDSVRITLNVEGGFASIPALAAAMTLNVESLPVAAAERVRTLVAMALQSPPPAAAPTPDARAYTIRIESDSPTVTLRYVD